MRAEKPIFCQVMDWIHPEQFRRCVQRYHGNHRFRRFSCWDQFLAMAFAQILSRLFVGPTLLFETPPRRRPAREKPRGGLKK